MIQLSQLDPTWSGKNIGTTTYTIGRYGCTLTSICMIGSKFFNDYYLPDMAAQKYTFTSDAMILWSQTDYNGLTFIKRGYGYNKAEIIEAAKSDTRGVILEVNSSHWVAVESTDGQNVSIIDPLHAVKYQDVEDRYTVTGYAIFEEISGEVSDYAKESVQKAIDQGIATDWSQPQAEVKASEIELMFMRLKVLSRVEPTGVLSKEDFVVALDRLGAFES